MKKTLTRETAKKLTEQERDKLIAECYALKVKQNKGTLTPTESERFRLLLKCGMLPSDPPPLKKMPDAFFRFVARCRIGKGEYITSSGIRTPEELQRVRFWEAELTSEVLSVHADIKHKRYEGRCKGVKDGKHKQPIKNAAGKFNADYEADYKAWIAQGKTPQWTRNQIAVNSGLKDAEFIRFKDSLRRYAERHGWDV